MKRPLVPRARRHPALHHLARVAPRTELTSYRLHALGDAALWLVMRDREAAREALAEASKYRRQAKKAERAILATVVMV